MSVGTSGLPIFTAEHPHLQSEDNDQANEYANIIYSCTWCNRARGVLPKNSEGNRLLDPTQDAWASYFIIKDDRLDPLDEEDALYTCNAYHLNDYRKVQRRYARRTEIHKLISWIREFVNHVQELTFWAEKYPHDRLSLLLRAQQFRLAINEAFSKLQDYTPIPADAPLRCRCGTTAMHCLPDEFLKQLVHIDVH